MGNSLFVRLTLENGTILEAEKAISSELLAGMVFALAGSMAGLDEPTTLSLSPAPAPVVAAPAIPERLYDLLDTENHTHLLRDTNTRDTVCGRRPNWRRPYGDATTYETVSKDIPESTVIQTVDCPGCIYRSWLREKNSPYVS